MSETDDTYTARASANKRRGIVSPDDHLVEPPDLWSNRLPSNYLEVAPRVVRERGRVRLNFEAESEGEFIYEKADDGDWADVWYYEDMRSPHLLPSCAAGRQLDEIGLRAVTYDDMRPGFYRQRERLEDMDTAGIEASLCFPNPFVRFCGQRFLTAKDKDLALLCVKAYNDFMIEEWSAGSNGRLIPLGVIPLWDPSLAVSEVRRVAARGMHAICFSELPPYLGLPSIHSGEWDPFFAACEDSHTVLMMHIGSSSKFPITSRDAPDAVRASLSAVNSAMCVVDWLSSGKFVQFPNLKIGLAECQIGWVPFFLERLDRVWDHRRSWAQLGDKVPEPPSSYFGDHIFCSFFDDAFGIANLERIGVDNVMFESDYPHQDTNWPNCLEEGERQTSHLAADQKQKILRENALRLLTPA